MTKGEATMNGSDAILKQWTSSLRVQSPNTARSYQEAVSRFLAHLEKPLADVKVTDAVSYVGSLAESGLSRASVAHHVSAVRSFLRHCQSLGLLPQSPLDALRRPRVTITSMNRYLDTEEAERLLQAARDVSPQCHLATALMLLTGVRVSELIGAEWRHVYRDPRGNIGLLVHGKGGKDRVVALRPDVWEVVKADRARRGLSEKLDAKDRGPLLAHRAGTAYTQSGIWRMLRKAADRAGIDKPLSAHWLRHSHATLAALGGASPYELQAALGHSRLETSARYVHWARGLDDSPAYRVGVRLASAAQEP